MNLKHLVGSGDRIALLTMPVLVIGAILNFLFPSPFSVGGPADPVRVIAIAMLVAGLILWGWSAALILINVPKGRLITSGPYALVKHPLYTAVALLVIPAIGFLLDTWLGVAVGAVLYLASRRYSPDEERELSATFGPAWDTYRASVMLPWL